MAYQTENDTVAKGDEEPNTTQTYDHHDPPPHNSTDDPNHRTPQNLGSLDVIGKNGIGRNGPMNSKTWRLIGGSVACTVIVAALVCCVLPLVVFLVVFFSILKESDEMMERNKEMMGSSSNSPQVSVGPGFSDLSDDFWFD